MNESFLCSFRHGSGATAALAQSTAKGELFGGYQYPLFGGAELRVASEERTPGFPGVNRLEHRIRYGGGIFSARDLALRGAGDFIQTYLGGENRTQSSRGQGFGVPHRKQIAFSPKLMVQRSLVVAGEPEGWQLMRAG